MDTHPDDLSDLERQLTAWEPAKEKLDADAMLFAAGRAASRAGVGRYVWPTLTGLFAVLVVLLWGWGMAERSERFRQAEQLRRHLAEPIGPAPSLEVPLAPAAEYEPGPTSILAVHRALERGQDDGAALPTVWTVSPDPPAAPSPVLQFGHRNALLEW